MAKVTNLTDSTLTAEVHFSFTFPTTDGKGREQEAGPEASESRSDDSVRGRRVIVKWH